MWMVPPLLAISSAASFPIPLLAPEQEGDIFFPIQERIRTSVFLLYRIYVLTRRHVRVFRKARYRTFEQYIRLKLSWERNFIWILINVNIVILRYRWYHCPHRCVRYRTYCWKIIVILLNVYSNRYNDTWVKLISPPKKQNFKTARKASGPIHFKQRYSTGTVPVPRTFSRRKWITWTWYNEHWSGSDTVEVWKANRYPQCKSSLGYR